MPDQTFSEELYDDAALKDAVDRMANLIKTHATKAYVDSAVEEKQDVLTFDDVPTENSENLVNSGAVYEAVSEFTGTLGYVTPEMFGAKGDGETDDSSAFQSALDSQKRIYITGTYLVPSISIPSKTTIIGGNATAKLIANIELDGLVRDCYFDNFQIVENESSSPVLKISNAYYNKFNKIIFVGSIPLVLEKSQVSDSCYFNSFDSCNFTSGNGGTSADVNVEINDGCNSNVFINCVMYGSNEKSVHIAGGQNNVFYKCVLQDYHGEGLYIDGDRTCIHNVFDCGYIEPDVKEAAEADYPYYNVTFSGQCRFNAVRNTVVGGSGVFKTPSQDLFCNIQYNTNIMQTFQGNSFPSVGSGVHFSKSEFLSLRSYEGNDGTICRTTDGLYFGEKNKIYRFVGQQYNEKTLNVNEIKLLKLQLSHRASIGTDSGDISYYAKIPDPSTPSQIDLGLFVGTGTTYCAIPKVIPASTYGMNHFNLAMFNTSFTLIRNTDTNKMYYAINRVIYDFDGNVFRDT